MPTPLDRALNSRNAFLAFAGLVTAVSAWTIWGPSDVFPSEPDPKGDPENWTVTELRRWLDRRGLLPSSNASQEELLERVKANMRTPPRA
ncbi:hypothetical protein H2201_001004 [Coniosporium apollinis]|uniref:STE24 endopeptidase n=2 Tax=Coniosporium TaxID=2810619 RepID=A0ABQ9P2C1_9PEZI|nr:hypothetical protein H2199_003206 [Cladosporium sp. JES 115]KAJ9668759.1 hypothetical protein H2201_001004 [Coniosporium apollinis]